MFLTYDFLSGKSHLTEVAFIDVKELIRKSDMRDNETGRHYVCLSLREAERCVSVQFHQTNRYYLEGDVRRQE